MTLKPIFVLFVSATLLCTIPLAKLRAQAVTIGHMTAEVVESVSASSKAYACLNVKNSAIITESTLNTLSLSHNENESLGTIKISSGTSLACNLVIHPVNSVKSKVVSSPKVSAIVKPDSGNAGRPDIIQSIQSSGTSVISPSHEPRLQNGIYSIIFAYN